MPTESRVPTAEAGVIVGIDLGTSTSEIAVLRNGVPTLLREIAGSSHGFLPSVVAVGADGDLRIGEYAVPLLAVRPEASIAEVKRSMGSDKRFSFAGETYTPQEISALILRHLKEQAETALGQPVTEAVITVPAYFNALQRRATHDAGELAGLTVRRLINEPTAAALAYGIERPDIEEKVVVYDLGGGTLDVTILEVSEGVLDVLASTGNDQLGGKDFDERLMRFLARTCRAATGIDPLASPKTKARLRGVAKRAKEELSSVERTSIALENLGLRPDGSTIDWEYTLTRAAFEAQIEDLIRSTSAQLDEALAQKGLRPDDINTVLMIGGSSRVPLVREHVSDYFGGRQLRTEVHPDEAVALGAAILAGIEARTIDPSQIVITDVSPWTLGVSVLEDRDGQVISGVFSPLIEKQSTIPRTVTKHFSTSRDWQDTILVEVFQGDAPICAQNIKVGEFELEQLERAPAGADVEISFSYNLSGELEVVAKALGQQRRVTMRPSARHLDETEKVAARGRIERRWKGGERALDQTASTHATAHSAAERARSAPLYSRVAPLVSKAERRLPQLSSGAQARLEVLLLEMRAALIANDERAVATVEQALTSLLFEFE
jgi:molecular chaperone DnaK